MAGISARGLAEMARGRPLGGKIIEYVYYTERGDHGTAAAAWREMDFGNERLEDGSLGIRRHVPYATLLAAARILRPGEDPRHYFHRGR